MFEVFRNMSFIHYIKSQFSYIIAINRYRKSFRNHVRVMWNAKLQNYPFNVVLKNGTETVINNKLDLITDLYGLEKSYQVVNNDVIISKKSFSSVRICDGLINGDIFGVFLNEDYGFLPVSGRTVIDIGANIGDSSIYFVLRGADRVIALEPFPKNYELAKKNIEVNHMSDKIQLILAGCSNKTDLVLVDPEEKGVSQKLSGKEIGIKIPLKTLNEILSTHDIKNAVLKLDCEGCEYKLIQNSSSETLRVFTHIQIEYHFGYNNLKDKLEKCGFRVSVSAPALTVDLKNKKLIYLGYLYAERKS